MKIGDQVSFLIPFSSRDGIEPPHLGLGNIVDDYSSDYPSIDEIVFAIKDCKTGLIWRKRKSDLKLVG